MKENVNRFLEKAAADQTLAEKLAALQEQYFAQLVTLAKEYGFELTPEDFAESVSPMGDDELEAYDSEGRTLLELPDSNPAVRGEQDIWEKI